MLSPQYFAHVVNGVVFEIVQIPGNAVLAECFAPAFVAELVPCSASVQQGWTYDGTTFAAPAPPSPPPPPTLQQQAMMLLGGPVTVACASVPAINGNYPLDAATQMQITGIAAAISAGFGVPGGGSTFNWPDTTGVPHPWPAAQFSEFAKAVMNFVYTAAQVAQGNGTALPSTILNLS